MHRARRCVGARPLRQQIGVLGIPLLKGRVFDARDDAESEPLVVLSAGAARRFFGEERAAGHMLESLAAPRFSDPFLPTVEQGQR